MLKFLSVSIIMGLLLFYSKEALPQHAGITGMVRDANGPVAWAAVGIKNTSIGTVTDEDGRFIIDDVPSGKQEIMASHIGFKEEVQVINIKENRTIELNFELKPSLNELNEMVITGTRTDKQKNNSAIAVSTLSSKTLENTQSLNLAEGLNFQPGLRVEVNCQTCNYTQLRINGLGGAYSQLLINNRPIFNSLMGLYGLEQVSSDMIEKVEVTKGGGSALFGSNAIAGTVNVITKEPTKDQFAIGTVGGLTTPESTDLSYYGNFTKTFSKAAVSIFATGRNRSPYDHNADGFTEIPKADNYSVGFKTHLKPSNKHKINFDFFKIYEYRRGGNKINEPAHVSDQAEERKHDIYVGGMDYTITLPNLKSNINTYLAGQLTKRKHYTGIDGVDAYGDTRNYSLNAGMFWNFYMKSNTLSFGVDYLTDDVFDEIPYYNYITDQTTSQFGIIGQTDWDIIEKVNLVAGFRIDQHNLLDKPIFNPRIGLLYKPIPNLKLRGSYGTGFRAPQAFDTDLHVAFAGGGISMIRLADDLVEERSKSFTTSLSWDRPSNKSIYGFTLEGFYTKLSDPFILEEKETDENENTIMEKRNGSDSKVYGITLEGRMNYDYIVELNFGFTFQKSMYADPVQWSSEIDGIHDYLRTPERYGFYTISINPMNHFHINLSGTITGTMKVPHYGGAPGVDGDRLEISPVFWNSNIKISQDILINKGKQELELSAGIQNIWNAYQDDFDTGRYRDSNYVYGPARPRTFFLGLKFSGIY
jgi:outer membrane receptor for ferrienterochelin and colicins